MPAEAGLQSLVLERNDHHWHLHSTCTTVHNPQYHSGGAHSPHPGPAPAPHPGGGHTLYCPSRDDFTGGASGLQWEHDAATGTSGWRMTGAGGVHGKHTFNLLDGWVEFEIDTTHAQTGVNNNFYTTSPEHGLFPKYCDIQKNDSPQCMEMDIVENNGNCVSQTTWHTWPNHNGGCDEGGCYGKSYNTGVRTMRASFSSSGHATATVNCKKVEVNKPTPSTHAEAYVAQQMAKLGAQFHSTQWVGWVPSGNCHGGGNIGASTFTVRKVRVYGTVVQHSGSEPRKCHTLSANSTSEVVLV